MTETSKETVLISDDIIKNKIYYIRNQRVMLDFELAEIYGYTTTRFNEQVKNNSEKFDDDFMFQLTKSEFDNLISKKSTSSWGGRRKLPYAFTEQGIYMLMTVLKDEGFCCRKQGFYKLKGISSNSLADKSEHKRYSRN